MPLLEVENLTTYYSTLRGPVHAVEDISFNVLKGESLGLAGESGCGKTTVALSILRILPYNGKVIAGKILLDGKDTLEISDDEMRTQIRWKGVSLIFQGAMNALNPVYNIEDQIKEAIRTHESGVTNKEAEERILRLFEMVGIEPSRVKNYPHEFSGGMKQRAMIAMALACNPKVLIADEPGTALDVIVQAQVLKLFNELKKRLELSTILISHDLSIISETCDKLAIMYAGKIVELGDIYTMFKEPLHPYTQGLISAFPNIKEQRRKMTSLPGIPPDLLKPPPGCRFHPRCNYAMDICRKIEPDFIEVSKDHFVACYLISKR
jgi:peptide/nickel transport system ATP-binding protein